jgi:uncharacterized SAM-binding protein YcdF (DUF218 family)
MRKKVYITIAVLLTLLAAWATAGFVSYAAQTRKLGGAACAQADAVVVLTGGKNRAEEGLKLLKSGNARILILSGVNKDAGLDSIFLNRLTNAERANIILDKESASTYQNAVEVRGVMKKMGLDSMLLITSGYHMVRAEYIFSKIMPDDVRILPCPVSSPNFDMDRWWAGDSLLLLFIEFVKYAFE